MLCDSFYAWQVLSAIWGMNPNKEQARILNWFWSVAHNDKDQNLFPIDRNQLASTSSEWSIMANAPKDGTHILVISDANLIPTPVHWFDGGWHLSSNWDGDHSEYAWGKPTEWTPCPEIPK